jgi:hypothetical protein
MPAHLRWARDNGVRNLPGTDPLPFGDEITRVGSFGLAVRGILNSRYPARDMKLILGHPETELYPYGALERPLRFVRNQARMQLEKLRRRRR